MARLWHFLSEEEEDVKKTSYVIAVVAALGLFAGAQSAFAQSGNPRVDRFSAFDRNNDGVITRSEWHNSPAHTWLATSMVGRTAISPVVAIEMGIDAGMLMATASCGQRTPATRHDSVRGRSSRQAIATASARLMARA